MVIAIDPGRDKCGVVAMTEDGCIKYQSVIETSELEKVLRELSTEWELQTIVLGNGTTSKAASQRIRSILPNIRLEIVNERNTTEEARRLYWEKNPPKGWRKLIPTSMQVPPVPVDDLAAEVMARRFLNSEE